MPNETIATFVVDLVSMPAAPGEAAAVAIARAVAEGLTTAGVACSTPTPMESGARFTGRVGRREVPIVVGRPAADSGRWFVSIGSDLMPLARLVGFKDEQARTRVTDAVAGALGATPGIDAVEWHDEESWSGRSTRRPW